MKKLILALCLVGVIAGAVVAFMKTEHAREVKTEYLRVHIRANSNLEVDQAVKYEVKDSVVAYLTPVVASCESKEEAMRKIEQSLAGAERVATSTLRQNGFAYGARARLTTEEFPTRVYDGVTLEAGVYDALILELGTGEGDNWWCVVYPPLCFTSGNGNVVYQSKILQIIRKFFG